MNWHQDPDNWHGPIHREERADIWDYRTEELRHLVFEYRECGCITTRPADA